MINITYTALHMRSQTEKTIFSFKDDYIDEAHTALDILRFAVFFVYILRDYTSKPSKIKIQQAQLGVPHSETQVELD